MYSHNLKQTCKSFCVLFYLIFAFISGSSCHEILGETVSRAPIVPTPSRNWEDARVTEAPSPELVRRQLQKRDFTTCTQWSVVGVSGIGCSTGTCVFGAQSGIGYQRCGTTGDNKVFYTNCYDYPASPIGLSPSAIIYCPFTQPYCGIYQFSISGGIFTNFGCSTKAYSLLVVTKPGATFPDTTSTSISTSTSIPRSSTTSPATTSVSSSTPISSTTPVSTTTRASTTTQVPSTTSILSSTSLTTSKSIGISTSTIPSPVTSSVDPIAPPNITPCSDPSWEPNPENWYDANVDQELSNWWKSTADKRGTATFVDWLAQSFGDRSRGQQCGIGAGSTCSAPDCQSFQSAGGPRWVYFVRIAVVNLNTLVNIMQGGMQDAETDLSLVISDMSANFFPWKDPRTDLQKAVPWIQAIVSGLLGFIPGVGPALKKGSGFKSWSPGLVESAKEIASAGFKAVGKSGTDTVTHQLGTVQELGTLIKQIVSSMRGELGSWSTTLFNGQQDVSGKTIMDYMAYGRFTLGYGVTRSFLDAAYFQVQVSKLVDGQWQDKKNAPSHTFVMCTNSTGAPCSESSKFTEGQRTCCLYSINNDANYVPPPSIGTLGNATYNITAADIVASSLHTYLAGGLTYDDTKINDRIQQTISLDNDDTFLAQGVRFQGVWTLPVCDVGQNGGWVAAPSSGKMPCCCGVGCSETNALWDKVGIPRAGAAQQKCKSQCSNCAISSEAAPIRSTSDMLQWLGLILGLWIGVDVARTVF